MNLWSPSGVINYDKNILISRSLPKLSSQDDDGPNSHTHYIGVAHFEPIPHDHDFCGRVVINVRV